MLSTGLALAVAGIALICALFAVLVAVGAKNISESAHLRLDHQPSPADVSVKQLTEIETTLTEHDDSLRALHASLKKLRSRAGMREYRARENGADAVPDPTTDPAGYKRAMRLKLKSEGVMR